MELEGIARLAAMFDEEGFDIAKSPGKFSLELQRCENGYKIHVSPVNGNRREIEISGTKADEYRDDKEFSELFDTADKIYEQMVGENSERRSEKKKGIMKKTLGTLALGMAITGAVWGSHNHFASPQVQRERELDRKAAYILPEGNTDVYRNEGRVTYSLNGGNATVRNAGSSSAWWEFGDREMQIDFEGVRFISESFCTRFTSSDDARNLERIGLIDEKGDTGRIVAVGETKNPSELQKQYEHLIERVYDAKITKEKEAMDAEQKAIDQAKNKIQEVAKKF
jgi:hypothetical protein